MKMKQSGAGVGATVALGDAARANKPAIGQTFVTLTAPSAAATPKPRNASSAAD